MKSATAKVTSKNQMSDKALKTNVCPECKGTGEAPRQRKDSPTFRCMECDGDGKWHHFEMIFWHYDHFPFVLASRGFRRKNGLAFCPSFNSSFEPCKILPLAEGQALKTKLETLTAEREAMLETVEKTFRIQLHELIPWGIKK